MEDNIALKAFAVPRFTVIAVYLAFAGCIFVIQGPTPPLNVDHIAYMKLTDKLLALHPDGAYWRSVSATTTYCVLLAYIHHFTGDDILSFKWMLAGMTVAYLVCAQIFFRSFTRHRLVAIVAALISAVHMSFGTVFWGTTDFADSLNRTLLLPPILLLLTWYFRHLASWRRFLSYPTLILLSLIHLSAYYLLGILAASDGLRLTYTAIYHRKAFLGDALEYVVAFVCVGVAYSILSVAHLNNTAFESLLPKIESPAARSLVTKEQFMTLSLSDARESPSAVSPIALREALNSPPWRDALSSKQAWRLELEAQPWRDFPPPVATVLGALGSIGFIALAAIGCGWYSKYTNGLSATDISMLMFACCVIVCSYGLQCTLWIARRFSSIYPMNFEEVRTISFLAIPILYWVVKGIDSLWYGDALRSPRRLIAVIVVFIILVQPIYLLRALPTSLREGIFRVAQSRGWLDPFTSQRNSFAREYLRLPGGSDALYYPLREVIEWLSTHTSSDDRILSTRDDLWLLPVRVIGSSNGFLDTSSASLPREAWSIVRKRLNEAISARDLQAVTLLGKDCEARFVVVPWSVPTAVFRSNGFSVVTIKP